MNPQEILSHLGLDERGAAIYLASLELGLASARDIAKKAGIQRTYFYDISEKLMKEGLIKQITKEKKRLFLAVDPERIVEVQERRLRHLKESLPRLKAIQNTLGEKPKVYFFEGREGIRQINEDTLKYEGEVLNFTTPRFVSADEERLSREYIGKRVASKIRARVIGEVSGEMMKLKERDPQELRETRVLPKNLFTSQVEVGIYGNRSYFANYKEEFGLIIEDSEISKTLKNVFELVWNSGRIVTD